MSAVAATRRAGVRAAAPSAGLQRGFLKNGSKATASTTARASPTTQSRDMSGYSAARHLPSGPSSFPRRAPMDAPQYRSISSSSSASQSHSKTVPPAEVPQNLARRFTAFYASNFERRPVATLCVANSILGFVGDAAAQLIPMIAGGGAGPVPSWDWSRSFRFWAYGFSLGPLIEKWNRFLEFRFPLRPVQQVFQEAPNPVVDLSHEDPSSPGFIDKLRKEAEKEGFKVRVERGDQDQGQSLKSAAQTNTSSSSTTGGTATGQAGSKIVDPQTIAIPNTTGSVSFSALFKRVFMDQVLFAPIGLALFIAAMGIMEGLDWPDVEAKLKKMWWPLTLINWQIWPFVQIINFRYMPLRYRVPFSSSLGILWTVFLSFRNAKAVSEGAPVQAT